MAITLSDIPTIRQHEQKSRCRPGESITGVVCSGCSSQHLFSKFIFSGIQGGSQASKKQSGQVSQGAVLESEMLHGKLLDARMT